MIYELTVFMIALLVFGAIMYVWVNLIAPDPNEELKNNIKELDDNDDRMRVIMQNGNTGEHYDSD